ncbi:hypothetical protein [Alkalimonas amylolytica]|uniref:Uncharacterized protein n=1 Tax=Alkalimonas amylolytica TaxID=152573 RepID=A0A1H3Y1N7_ALKAM|nr:hypothetical protein [Alkalimonas amylolytica]SEA05645.1 hypothetical protein SAMN04488051_101508 [Alkalimonas amylolytica]
MTKRQGIYFGLLVVLGLVLLKLNVVEVNLSVTHSHNIALEQIRDRSLADLEKQLQTFAVDKQQLAAYLRPMGKTVADFEDALIISIVADEAHAYALQFASSQGLDPFKPGMINFGKQFHDLLQASD